MSESPKSKYQPYIKEQELRNREKKVRNDWFSYDAYALNRVSPQKYKAYSLKYDPMANNTPELKPPLLIHYSLAESSKEESFIERLIRTINQIGKKVKQVFSKTKKTILKN